MNLTNLTIYVEGSVDKLIITELLKITNMYENTEVIVLNGKLAIKQKVYHLKNSATQKYIALIDSDKLSVSDSIEEARKQLDFPEIDVYCSVPEIESWLFADKNIVKSHLVRPEAIQVLERIPLPEYISYPKQLANSVFKEMNYASIASIISTMNINDAVARCPSMRVFLSGVAKIFDKEIDFNIEPISNSIGRDAFSTLLQEVSADKVMWKTLDGSHITAKKLAEEISQGSSLGKQYVTEVLRIARDMIARSSAK